MYKKYSSIDFNCHYKSPIGLIPVGFANNMFMVENNFTLHPIEDVTNLDCEFKIITFEKNLGEMYGDRKHIFKIIEYFEKYSQEYPWGYFKKIEMIPVFFNPNILESLIFKLEVTTEIYDEGSPIEEEQYILQNVYNNAELINNIRKLTSIRSFF